MNAILKIDLEEKRITDEIRRRGAKRVLLQFPDGLKVNGSRLANIVEKCGALAIVSATPCYGACDLAIHDAESLDVDLIIHFGHTEMVKQEKVPAIYVEARAEVSVGDTLRKSLIHLEGSNRVGLVTTIQHVHKLNDIKKALIETGRRVEIGKSNQVRYAGQVTGCDYTNAKSIMNDVDAFLFIGGGKFHAIGVALATAKSTIVADLYERRAYDIESTVQKVIKQRWASICEAKNGKTFGVLIGLKSGQKRVREAVEIKRKLERSGKNVVLLALREITAESLSPFSNIDGFISTACPRVSIDGLNSFFKPILTSEEALVMLGEISWEELCRRGWFGS